MFIIMFVLYEPTTAPIYKLLMYYCKICCIVVFVCVFDRRKIIIIIILGPGIKLFLQVSFGSKRAWRGIGSNCSSLEVSPVDVKKA